MLTVIVLDRFHTPMTKLSPLTFVGLSQYQAKQPISIAAPRLSGCGWQIHGPRVGTTRYPHSSPGSFREGLSGRRLT